MYLNKKNGINYKKFIREGTSEILKKNRSTRQF